MSYGVWSDMAGGFIDGPYHTLDEADESLQDFLANGEDDVEITKWFDNDDEWEDDES